MTRIFFRDTILFVLGILHGVSAQPHNLPRDFVEQRESDMMLVRKLLSRLLKKDGRKQKRTHPPRKKHRTIPEHERAHLEEWEKWEEGRGHMGSA